MLNIIVCDDDALQRGEIIKCVQNALGAVRADVSDFHDPAQLLEYLHETDVQPHIALLDICMPEQDGISLARDLKEYAPSCQIIFLSSYLSYTTEVYEVEHIYFILKSQLQQRIGAALHRALAVLGDSTAQIAVEKDKVTIDNGASVPISRTYSQSAKRQFLQRLVYA